MTPTVVNDSLENETTGTNGNQMYGPYAINDVLFVPVSDPTGNVLTMCVSLDNGGTWTTVAGAACDSFACAQAGNDLVCVLDDGGTVSISRFDTATQLWNALPGTVSPTGLICITGLWSYAVGAYWMLTAGDDGAGNILYLAYPYTGVAFGAPLDLTTNFGGTALLTDGVHETSCFANGLIHVFIAADSSADGVSHFYQSFSVGGALQSNFRFESVAPDVLDDGATGQPVAYAGKVVWPCVFVDTGSGTQRSQVYVGTPDTAPVWSGPFETDLSFNPTAQSGRAAIVGADIVITFTGQSTNGDGNDALVQCITTSVDPTTGWASSFAIDGTSNPVDFNSLTGTMPGSDIVGALTILFDAGNSVTGLPGAFILSSSIPPPSPVPVQGPILNAQTISPIALSTGSPGNGIAYLDSTGANRHCFPILKKRKVWCP